MESQGLPLQGPSKTYWRQGYSMWAPALGNSWKVPGTSEEELNCLASGQGWRSSSLPFCSFAEPSHNPAGRHRLEPNLSLHQIHPILVIP